MLFKELYAITVPLFCAIYLFESKRYRAAVASLILIPLYFVYRYYVFGRTVDGGSPLLRPAEYLIYLGRLPYALAGNFGGYALVVVAIVLLIVFAREQARPGRFLIYAALVLGSDMVVIYPVAFPVSLQWHEHGTWCRSLFLFGIGLLITGGIAFLRAPLPLRACIV